MISMESKLWLSTDIFWKSLCPFSKFVWVPIVLLHSFLTKTSTELKLWLSTVSWVALGYELTAQLVIIFKITALLLLSISRIFFLECDDSSRDNVKTYIYRTFTITRHFWIEDANEWKLNLDCFKSPKNQTTGRTKLLK